MRALPNDPPVNRVFTLPASFNPAELLPSALHRYQDDARYLASTIIRKTARGQADAGGYVPLKAEYLRNIISERRGRDVIQSLLAEKAIHRTPYQVGRRSFAYRLDDRYRTDPHIRRPVESKRLIRNLDKHAASCARDAAARMKPVHHTLARLQQDLEIDGAASEAILTTLPVESNPYDVQGVLVRDIIDRRFRLSVGNYGRVANSVTSMKREIRAALRCAGQPLSGVDIACAQPSFLAWMMTENVTSYNAVPRVVSAPAVPAALFAACCFSGELYGLLGLRLRDSGVDWTREQIKKRFLTDVLAKRKASSAGAEYWSPIEDIFRAEFPEVWGFIRDVNRHGFEHARLIRMLQQIEAWIVIEQVCGTFVQQYPGTFCITIHDAVYVQPDMLGALVSVFDAVFERLNFRPMLKVEPEQSGLLD